MRVESGEQNGFAAIGHHEFDGLYAGGENGAFLGHIFE